MLQVQHQDNQSHLSSQRVVDFSNHKYLSHCVSFQVDMRLRLGGFSGMAGSLADCTDSVLHGGFSFDETSKLTIKLHYNPVMDEWVR